MEAKALVNLLEVAQRLSQNTESWSSEQIGSFNGSQVNVRVMHPIITDWHVHADTDELFVVLSGSVTIDTEDGEFLLSQSDCFIVKTGMRHRAITEENTMLMTLICKSI